MGLTDREVAEALRALASYGAWVLSTDEVALVKTAAERLEDAQELVVELTQQGVYDEDGLVDSCAISTYADALRWCAAQGLFEITESAGRRVIGRWK